MPVEHHDLLSSLRAAGIELVEVLVLAAGLAEALARQDGLDTEGARECAPAFVIGLADGARRRLPQADIAPGCDLADIVDRVAFHGRHTVIAQHCDLSEVATNATLTATLICRASDPTVDVDDRPLEMRTCVRLFESGLAAGLLLPGND